MPTDRSCQIRSSAGRGRGVVPNKYLISRVNISSATVGEDDHISATELNSHANMVVAGRDVLVIQDTGLTANVNPFFG